MNKSTDHLFGQDFLEVLGSEKHRSALVEWLRSSRVTDSSTPRAPATENPSIRTLVEAWDSLWALQLASVVQERLPSTDASAAISGLHVPDTPGVELWELVERQYEFSSLPVDLLRKSRRWWKRFDLDAMIEDRIYADYRDVLEKERIALVDSAREIQGNCDSLRRQLGKCAEKAKAFPEPELLAIGTQFNVISGALTQTYETCGAFLQVLEDQKFRVCFYEAIRSLHAEVQDAWGTWSRRVRAPLLFALIALAAVIVVLHPLFGFLTGSSTALPLLLLLPVAAFMSKYYLGLKRCRQLIDGVVARVAVFNPEPAKNRSGELIPPPPTQPTAPSSGSKLGSFFGRKSAPVAVEPGLTPAPETFLLNENTVWNPGKSRKVEGGIQRSLRVKELANGAYRLTIALAGRTTTRSWNEMKRAVQASPRAQEEEESLRVVELSEAYASSGPGSSGTSGNSWRSLLWVFGGLIASLLLLLKAIGDGSSRVTVYSMLTDGPCALAIGYMVWPGPGDLLLISVEGDQNASGTRWMRIPGTHVHAVEGYRERTRLCKDAGKTEVESGLRSPSSINFYQSGQSAERAMVVVPFAVDYSKAPGGEVAAIGCTFGAEEAAIPADVARMLRRLGDGLKECGRRDGGLAEIDVRGFASSVPFAGECASESNKKNLELAEMRRNSVLHAMFGDGKFPGRYPESWVWKPGGIVIKPSGPKRYTSLEHMSDFSAVRDEGSSDRYLTQRAEVWVLSAGGCSSRTLLPLRAR